MENLAKSHSIESSELNRPFLLTDFKESGKVGRDLFALKLVFYQEVNGKMYVLSVGTATTSAIIGVA
ncbi:MAG: hypothetical protein R2787_12145 [Saprospiraceae bacterium]